MNPASTRPSLQTLQSPAKSHPAGDYAAAAGQRRDCSRCIAGACADNRASIRDGFAPTHAVPVPGSRDSPRRWRALLAANGAVVHADRLEYRNNAAVEPANAAEMPARTPHIAASPQRPSAQITCTERPPPAPNTISPRRTCNRAPRPQTRRFRSRISVRSQAGYRPPQQGGSIPMSTPGSIPVSVEVHRAGPRSCSPRGLVGSSVALRRQRSCVRITPGAP